MIIQQYRHYLQFFVFLSIVFFLLGCSQTHQANLERLDKIHGVCDNPYRNYTKDQYYLCKIKERAQGKELRVEDLEKTFGEMVAGAIGRDNQNSMSTAGSFSPYNRFLWQSSLQTLSPFPLKIADNVGGYIETDWIADFNNDKNLRCQVKVFVLSAELVSNGVNTKINCQSYDGSNWIDDNQDYASEEKQITLTILKAAQEQSQSLS